MKRTEYLLNKASDLSSIRIEIDDQKGNNCNILLMPKATKSKRYHLFNVPKMNTRTVRRTTFSPKRRVISGRVKNDAKAKLPKIMFRPCPSFANSNRNSIHCSNLKNNQIRKEVIKKMVWLTDFPLSENKEITESTPVKPFIKLTPNKSLRSHNYFLIPEFAKKKTNISELRTPLKEFVKREINSSANRALTFLQNSNLNTETSNSSLNFENNVDDDSNTFELNVSNQNSVVDEIFRELQQYNSAVGGVYDKLKSLDDIFRNNIKGLSYNEIYDRFQDYQLKKEDLYKEIKIMEEKLKAVFDTQLNWNKKLDSYMENKKKLWEKRTELHKEFESFVEKFLQKIKKNTNKSKKKQKIVKSPFAEEKPMLRRSLRISKIPRAKTEDKTMNKR